VYYQRIMQLALKLGMHTYNLLIEFINNKATVHLAHTNI